MKGAVKLLSMFKIVREKAGTIVPILTFTLIMLGLAVLSSASSNMGKIKFDDTYYFVRHQLINGFAVGMAGMLAGIFVPLKYIKKGAFVFLLLNIILLGLVFTPLGGGFGTANRWIDLYGVVVQPSELLKITFIVYLSAWLSGGRKNRRDDLMEGLVPFLIICSIIAVLLLMQPATSILAILLIVAFAIYLISGMKLSFIPIMFGLAALGIGAMIIVTPYRMNRITTFLNPSADLQGKSYHLNQALTTIGSGGLTGVGYGQSKLKISSLPEPIGDSIFAIVAEEFGFIGAIFFILLYFFYSFTGLIGSLEVKSEFGKLVLIGFSSLIGIQAFVHIASISGVIPMTGVPLPFISYGGTALAVFMTMSGLMINIFKNG